MCAENLGKPTSFNSVGRKPVFGCRYSAAMASEIDHDSIAFLNKTVVCQMRHEAILNVVFGCLAVQQHADLIIGNVKVVDQPRTDKSGVVNTGMKIPDVARFVVVDANDESESTSGHTRDLANSEYTRGINQRVSIPKRIAVLMSWRLSGCRTSGFLNPQGRTEHVLWVYSLIATQNAGNKTCAFSTRLRTAHGLFNLMVLLSLCCRGDRIVQATVDEMEETESE